MLDFIFRSLRRRVVDGELLFRQVIAILFVVVLLTFYVWFTATHLDGIGPGDLF